MSPITLQVVFYLITSHMGELPSKADYEFQCSSVKLGKLLASDRTSALFQPTLAITYRSRFIS